MIYRGIPYIAIGSNSSWTTRKIKIEKIWYPIPYSKKYEWISDLHFKFPVLLKVKLFNKEKPFSKNCIEIANRFAELRQEYFDEIDLHMNNYFSKQDGSYIGGADDVYRLVKRFGITEFYDYDEPKTSSIGWSPSEQKWYGWSHRAITAFGIGSKRVEGNIGFDEFGAFEATTLEEARKMAEQFARSVA